jgi:hypothetical protein
MTVSDVPNLRCCLGDGNFRYVGNGIPPGSVALLSPASEEPSGKTKGSGGRFAPSGQGKVKPSLPNEFFLVRWFRPKSDLRASVADSCPEILCIGSVYYFRLFLGPFNLCGNVYGQGDSNFVKDCAATGTGWRYAFHWHHQHPIGEEMETTEPKYLMDEASFYWNPLYADNYLLFTPEPTADETVKKHKVPVRIFRNGEPVEPNGNLPEDIAVNSRRL